MVPTPDVTYRQARARAFFVGVSCAHPAATCFCTSMGTGPAIETGHDLAVTELLDGDRHDLLVSAGSEHGQEVLADLQEQVAWKAAGDRDASRTSARRRGERRAR